MAAIPPPPQESKTLSAGIAAFTAERSDKPRERRRLIRLAKLGGPCERALWQDAYSKADPLPIGSRGKMIGASNFRTKDLVLEIMQAVPGLTLYTNDEYSLTGRIMVEDFDGKLVGTAEGVGVGFVEAPKAWHVYACKVTKESEFKKLAKLRDIDEKTALRRWDQALYDEAVLMMGYLDCPRHFLAVATPGARDMTSVRTDTDPVRFAELRARAARILAANKPLAKVSDSADWFQCRFCDWRVECHGEEAVHD